MEFHDVNFSIGQAKSSTGGTALSASGSPQKVLIIFNEHDEVPAEFQAICRQLLPIATGLRLAAEHPPAGLHHCGSLHLASVHTGVSAQDHQTEWRRAMASFETIYTSSQTVHKSCRRTRMGALVVVTGDSKCRTKYNPRGLSGTLPHRSIQA